MVTAMHQKFAVKALAQIIQRNIELVGMPNWTQEEIKFAEEVQKSIGKEESGLKREIEPLKAPPDVFIGGASTDVGDVSLVAPTATLLFPVMIPGSPGHHWSIVASSGSSIGHKGLTAGAKVMACTAIDLLTQPEKLLEVRSEFERLSNEHPYRSFLPQDMWPDPDFYKTEMERWRPLMEPYYKEPTIESQR